MDRQQIEDLVAAAIVEVNAQLPEADRVSTDPDVVLAGEGGTLDSLALVSLFASLEQAIASRGGSTPDLLGGTPLEAHASLRVADLVDWIDRQSGAKA